MNFMELTNANLGKRMMAFAWTGWLIKECADERQQLLLVALGCMYMICQTVSDWKNGA